jgi:protein-disulfide isomerase
MAGVVAVAGLHALWALFQWNQLVAARTGGSAFCGISESASCTQIWDSAFASAIQNWTGVPVAGWGLIWSLAAFALPLWALVQRAADSDPSEPTAIAPAWAATVWLAIGGLVAIAGLFTVSLLEGLLCTTCVLTYTLVAIYAAGCFVQTPSRTVPLARGASLASGALALAFVLLFIPGLKTPLSKSAAGRQVLDRLAQAPTAPGESGEPRPEAAAPETRREAALAGVRELLENLPPPLAQTVSNELQRYANAPHVTMRPARALIGDANAPVRLTQFTDVLCSHCADLHDSLEQLAQTLPAGTFAVEARHFPLDSACNPALRGESKTPVRCLAARSAICLEGRAEAFAYAGSIYHHQGSLDEEKVVQLAEPILTKNELVSCVNDPATNAKLQEDIAWAMEHDLHGTPLVLLNGKKASSFVPLLYALILMQGDAEHEVFSELPEPEADSGDPHAGHGH